ncbi:substrate-binding domain-containing protein [Cohnella cholangitidis]|nr:substrate-binding domain-containing protein [Cohnella cholangitidis]
MSDKSVPMYQHIIDDMKSKIKSGEFEMDKPLPNQIDLAKIYNTSEITSRRALAELVKEGYIYRIRGKGSFITDGESRESSPSAIRTVYFVYNDLTVDVLNHRYWSDMLESMKEECDENGVNFYIWASGTGENYVLPEDPHAAYVLVTAPYNSDQPSLERWKNEGKRMVTVQFYYPHLSIPYVIADNLTGGFLATQHLLSLGHKRTGIILTGQSMLDLNQEFSLRLQGYRLALQQHQIPFDPELVCVMDGPFENVNMGYEGFKQLYKRTDNPPTAVFVTSDIKAMGALKAAQDMGLNVPNDVSIVGYDDLRISSFTYPHLTTINQNTAQIGRRAIEILLNEIPKNSNLLVKDEIVPKLIVRNTTRALGV